MAVGHGKRHVWTVGGNPRLIRINWTGRGIPDQPTGYTESGNLRRRLTNAAEVLQ
jgi:hypothetical protein